MFGWVSTTEMMSVDEKEHSMAPTRVLRMGDTTELSTGMMLDFDFVTEI
jgi:hypothetical protein